jgi:hypothetical protein
LTIPTAATADTASLSVALQMVLSMEGVTCRPKDSHKRSSSNDYTKEDREDH